MMKVLFSPKNLHFYKGQGEPKQGNQRICPLLGDNLRMLELENNVGCRKNLQSSTYEDAKSAFPAEDSCERATAESQKY